jgi:hypothetical protein
MFHKEVQADHSEEHEQGVRAPVLGKVDMVRHKCQGKRAGKSNEGGKLPGKKVDHGNRKGSKDQRKNTQIPFGFFKWVEEMSENKKERGMEESRVLFIEF